MRRSYRTAKVGSSFVMAAVVGTDRVCDCNDCASWSGDGNSVSKWTAADGKQLVAGAAVLLGTKRDNVSDWINRYCLCGFDGRLSGSNANRKCVLCAGGVGIKPRISRSNLASCRFPKVDCQLSKSATGNRKCREVTKILEMEFTVPLLRLDWSSDLFELSI